MNDEILERKICDSLPKAFGQVSRVAEILDCAVGVIYAQLERSSEMQDTLRYFRCKMLDLAETAIWKGLIDRESWAVKLAFDLWGRSRTYTDGGEHWHKRRKKRRRKYDPELIRNLVKELLENETFTEFARWRTAQPDSSDVRKCRKPGALEDRTTSQCD